MTDYDVELGLGQLAIQGNAKLYPTLAFDAFVAGVGRTTHSWPLLLEVLDKAPRNVIIVLFRVFTAWIILPGWVSNYFQVHYPSASLSADLPRTVPHTHFDSFTKLLSVWSEYLHGTELSFLGGSPDGMDPGFRERLDGDTPNSPTKPVKVSPRKALRQRRYSDRYHPFYTLLALLHNALLKLTPEQQFNSCYIYTCYGADGSVGTFQVDQVATPREISQSSQQYKNRQMNHRTLTASHTPDSSEPKWICRCVPSHHQIRWRKTPLRRADFLHVQYPFILHNLVKEGICCGLCLRLPSQTSSSRLSPFRQ
jgi:hypothetical protein